MLLPLLPSVDFADVEAAAAAAVSYWVSILGARGKSHLCLQTCQHGGPQYGATRLTRDIPPAPRLLPIFPFLVYDPFVFVEEPALKFNR